MFTIDENGVIIGHEKGQSFLKIVSKSDKNVTMTITVRIEQGRDYNSSKRTNFNGRRK